MRCSSSVSRANIRCTWVRCSSSSRLRTPALISSATPIRQCSSPRRCNRPFVSTPPSSAASPTSHWSFDREVELDYHLRRSALPEPGRIRDLLELASRLHSGLLDRHRPLWEAHLVEGLQDGRYAVYTKYHHSLMDGVSALRLMQRAFASDPGDDSARVPWSLAPRKSKTRQEAVTRYWKEQAALQDRRSHWHHPR